MDLYVSKWNGRKVLEHTLQKAGFSGITDAIAQLTVFSHPKTVEQTENKSLFRTIRYRQGEKIGSINKGLNAYVEYNHSAQAAFCWSNGLPCQNRRIDVQFNHIWSESRNVETYTSLANICVTPAFLAKLTDTSEAVEFLKYRAWELYKYWPNGSSPKKPEGYDDVNWSSRFPEPVPNLEKLLRERMSKNLRNHAVKASIQLGWLYGEYSV